MNHEENTPTPPGSIPPELEARVVAWVAGEATPAEAEELASLVAASPALAAFHRRIASIQALVTEAERPERDPLRLSPDRRAKLLQTLGATNQDAPAPVAATVVPPKKAKSLSWPTPRLYYFAPLLLAACFAVMFVLHRSAEKSRLSEIVARAEGRRLDKTQYLEVTSLEVPEKRREAKAPEGEPAKAVIVEMPLAKLDRFAGSPTDNEKAKKSDGGRLLSEAQKDLKQESLAVVAQNHRTITTDSVVSAPTFSFDKSPSAIASAGGTVTLNAPAVAGMSGRRDLGAAAPSDANLRPLLATASSPASTPTATSEVIHLDAFEVSAPAKARSTATTDPASPVVLEGFVSTPPSVSRPAAPAASSAAPAITVPAFAPAATPTPFSDQLAATTPVYKEIIPVVSLDSRKDIENAALKAANAEAVRAELKLNDQRAKAAAPAAPVPPAPANTDTARRPPTPPAPLPPVTETSTAQDPVSTFSLHVSDVSFRLARAALARGEAPDPARIRPEEFYNAFDYGEPAPTTAEKIGARFEQAAHPFLQQRNFVRLALKVPTTGRGAATPLRLTVLLDTSGSMEREDRAASVRRALEVLASLLGPNDRLTLVGFARQPHLLAENLPGDQARQILDILKNTPAEGGTNLEEALKLGGELARRYRTAGAQNRLVMLTDGAANLGDADPAHLATLVTTLRQNGIAFDACGVGLDGLDDEVLEALTRQGDGRYYVLDSPEAADAGFARQLAGAFRPAAENVKVQVRFNPARVGHYRLIGFDQHRLREEDFRNDQVDAAELAAEEAAVALYQVEVLPQGEGELGEVFVRFRDAATGTMVERSWSLPYDPAARAFDRAAPPLQLAGTAALLAERLRGGPAAAEIKLRDLAPVVNSLRGHYADSPRVQDLTTMFAQSRRLLGD